MRIRRARTGGYLLEIPDKEGDTKADSVAAGIFGRRFMDVPTF